MPDPESTVPPEPEPSAEKSLEVERIGQLLRQMCITRSNLTLYSFAHAVPRRNLAETQRVLAGILGEKECLSLDIYKTTLLFEGLPIEERNPMVEKLAKEFRNLHVSGVTFQRGITLKELAVFFKLLTLKREELEACGGAKEILQSAGVKNIGVNQVRYIRLEEDQKVVSQTARVLEGASATMEGVEKAFLEQLWQALMAKQVDREWLMEEIRADPRRAANQIVALLKYYDDLETLEHQEKRQEALESLMNSIKTLGVRLAERDTEGEAGSEDQRTIAQSLLILEQELKTRSAGLKTSQAASHFIQEITNTVTAFIDNIQADQILKEYLKDEEGLKRTEHLLRKVLQRDSPDKLMPRFQHLLQEKGLTDKDFEAILAQLSPPAAVKRPRRRRPPKALAEKLERALTRRLESAEDKESALAYLTGVIQREVQEKLIQASEEKVRLASALKRVDDVVSAAGLCLVVLDEAGGCVMATRMAKEMLGGDLEEAVDPEFAEFVTAGNAASPAARESFLSRQPEDRRERYARLLNAFDHPLLDDQGHLLGLVLKAG